MCSQPCCYESNFAPWHTCAAGTDLVVPVHTGLRLFATQNGAKYANRQPLPLSIRTRFLEVQVDNCDQQQYTGHAFGRLLADVLNDKHSSEASVLTAPIERLWGRGASDRAQCTLPLLIIYLKPLHPGLQLMLRTVAVA